MKFFLFFLFFTCASFLGNSQTFVYNGINYSVTSSSTVDVGINTSFSGSAIIPDTVFYSGNSYSVKGIQNNAFSMCGGLQGISLPDGLMSIGNGAFSYCYALTSISIPNSVSFLGEYLFNSCNNLSFIVLPDSLTTISPGTFVYCVALDSINIPSGVISIGHNAFQNCSSLINVNIPNGVTNIGSQAFKNCTSLSSIFLGNSLVSLEDEVFNFCSSLTNVAIPNSVISIGNGAFSGCLSLANINLGNSIITIGDYSFAQCQNLLSIDLPPVVVSLGNYALSNCLNLESIQLSDSLSNIGFSAFEYCNSLLNIIIPPNVTVLKNNTFYGCSSLQSVSLPPGLMIIDDNAFVGCLALTTIDIGNSVTNIGNSAFNGCSGLTSILIGNNVESIGDGAFGYCTSLTTFTSGNSVSSIGVHAFMFCTSLKTVIFTDALNDIGNFVFDGCDSLSLVVSANPIPLVLSQNVFMGVNLNNVNLCVPIGSAGAYQAASYWQDFSLISEGQNLVPIFAPIPSYCYGSLIPPLPTTSINGVTGSWSPAINSTSSAVYTFTPNNGCIIKTIFIEILQESVGVENVVACDSFTWIDGVTYTETNNTSTFTLTNQNGCDSIVTLNLTIKKAILSNNGVTTTSSCDGTLLANMSNGVAPFSFEFNSMPPQSSNVLNNACAGFNVVTISDATGCSSSANYYLPYSVNTPPLTANIIVSPTTGSGMCNGQAEVIVTGGIQPYSYLHASGSTTAITSGLCEGVYGVTVTDSIGTTVYIPYMVASDTNTLYVYQDTISNAYNIPPVAAIENCNINYFDVDSVNVSTVTPFAVDSVTVVWNVYSGGMLEVILVDYYIGFGQGYYNFILDVYCPTKSTGKFLKVTAKLNISSLLDIQQKMAIMATIYPNPFTDKITVSLTQKDDYKVFLLDISGRELLNQTFMNSDIIELSHLDNLAKGEYILHVQSSKDTFVRKLLK